MARYIPISPQDGYDIYREPIDDVESEQAPSPLAIPGKRSKSGPRPRVLLVAFVILLAAALFVFWLAGRGQQQTRTRAAQMESNQLEGPTVGTAIAGKGNNTRQHKFGQEQAPLKDELFVLRHDDSGLLNPPQHAHDAMLETTEAVPASVTPVSATGSAAATTNSFQGEHKRQFAIDRPPQQRRGFYVRPRPTNNVGPKRNPTSNQRQTARPHFGFALPRTQAQAHAHAASAAKVRYTMDPGESKRSVQAQVAGSGMSKQHAKSHQDDNRLLDGANDFEDTVNGREGRKRAAQDMPKSDGSANKNSASSERETKHPHHPTGKHKESYEKSIPAKLQTVQEPYPRSRAFVDLRDQDQNDTHKEHHGIGREKQHAKRNANTNQEDHHHHEDDQRDTLAKSKHKRDATRQREHYGDDLSAGRKSLYNQ